MLNFMTLRPVQAMAASAFFKHRRLMLSLPRQFGGKTELGVRLTQDLLTQADPRQAIFLAKDKKSAKRSVRDGPEPPVIRRYPPAASSPSANISSSSSHEIG